MVCDRGAMQALVACLLLGHHERGELRESDLETCICVAFRFCIFLYDDMYTIGWLGGGGRGSRKDKPMGKISSIGRDRGGPLPRKAAEIRDRFAGFQGLGAIPM